MSEDPWVDVRERLNGMQFWDQALATKGIQNVQQMKEDMSNILADADALLGVVRAAQALDLELGWSIRRISKPESITGWRVNLLDALAALPDHLREGEDE